MIDARNQTGAVRTDSGLIVPKTAITKKQRVMTNDTLKKAKRFLREMKAEGIVTALVCEHCKQPLELQLVDQILDDYGNTIGGRPRLDCQCTERVVR